MLSDIISFTYSATTKKLFDVCDNVGIFSRCTTISNISLFEAAFNNAVADCDIIFIVAPNNIAINYQIKKNLAQFMNAEMLVSTVAENNLKYYCSLSKEELNSFKQEQIVLFPDNLTCVASAYGYDSCAYGSYKGKQIYFLCDNEDETNLTLNNYFFKMISSGSQLGEYYVFKMFGLTYETIDAAMIEFNLSRVLTYKIETDFTLDTKLTLIFNNNITKSGIDNVFSLIYNKFSKNIYADTDITLQEQLVKLAISQNRVIGVAESLTGGLIANKIVSVANASKMFNEALVTYSNASKSSRLFVDKKVIDSNGAVSSEVAYQMGMGLLNSGSCDIIITTTGIAGPTGGTVYKPVGLAYTAVGDKNLINVFKSINTGNRQQIREKVCNDAIFRVIKLLFRETF